MSTGAARWRVAKDACSAIAARFPSSIVIKPTHWMNAKIAVGAAASRCSGGWNAAVSTAYSNLQGVRKLTVSASRSYGIAGSRGEGRVAQSEDGVCHTGYKTVSMLDRQMVDIQADANEIVKSAMLSADMTTRIQERLKVIETNEEGKVFLEVDETKYEMDRNIHLVAFGKGVLNIVKSAVNYEPIASHIVQGIAIIPDGMADAKLAPGIPTMILKENVEVYGAAADRRPDAKTAAVSKKVVELCRTLKEDDILLVVCTGGGSNLFQLPLLEDHVSQETINELISQMQRKGATREETNTLRRHLSAVKGGRFAVMMQKTKILTLIVSDVVDNKLETIASGPTFPEKTSPVMCLDLLNNYQIDLPSVTNYFERRSEEEQLLRLKSQGRDTFLPPHRDKEQFHHVQNVLLANNRELIQGAVEAAERLGYRTLRLSDQEFGEVKDKAELYAKLFPFLFRLLRRKLEQPDKILAVIEMELIALGLDKEKAKQVAHRAQTAVNTASGICLVLGGEFTCSHEPGAVGGVYQEMALRVAMLLHQQKQDKENMSEDFESLFVAFDTDGIDGNTSAAGACANHDTVQEAKRMNLSPTKALEGSNSYQFFSQLCDGKYHLVTGPIALDLMGLLLLLVRPRNMDSVQSGIKTIQCQKEEKINNDKNDNNDIDDTMANADTVEEIAATNKQYLS